MFERGITKADVQNAVMCGEIIANYDDDRPYPSKLILWRGDNKTIHVVVADNISEKELIVITAYIPDPELWRDDFRRRR